MTVPLVFACTANTPLFITNMTATRARATRVRAAVEIRDFFTFCPFSLFLTTSLDRLIGLLYWYERRGLFAQDIRVGKSEGAPHFLRHWRANDTLSEQICPHCSNRPTPIITH